MHAYDLCSINFNYTTFDNPIRFFPSKTFYRKNQNAAVANVILKINSKVNICYQLLFIFS